MRSARGSQQAALWLFALAMAACQTPAGAAAVDLDATGDAAWVDKDNTCHLPLGALPTSVPQKHDAAVAAAQTACTQDPHAPVEHTCASGVHIVVGEEQAWFFAPDGTLLAYHHWSDWLRPQCLTGNDLYGTLPDCPDWQVRKYPFGQGTVSLCQQVQDVSKWDPAPDVVQPDVAQDAAQPDVEAVDLAVTEVADAPDTATASDAGGGEGATCNDPSQPACAAGLVCCYPCGIPGCQSKCIVPCKPGPGCVGGCFLAP